MNLLKKKNRHLLIIALLKNKPFLKIDELCQELNISPATVRRDLTELEQSRSIIRINGGAIVQPRSDESPDNQSAPDPFLSEKRKIAEAAAALVKAGDTLFLDAGSTNLEIAYRLADFSNITIVTNSIVIAHTFINRKDLSVIICGGTLGEANPYSIVGPVAEKMISMFRANICFLGASGFHIKQGITDRYLATARIKENMIANSTKVCLATDSSKFGVINSAFVCPIESISHIITDNMAPKEDIDYLISREISVTLV
jgi:DeoR/GlpR family transcriptional regulator of sugar metabolism